MGRIEFPFPDPGEGIASAEVVEWHAAVGDSIPEHAPLVDVQTDKAIVAITCPVAGELVQRGAEPGETIAVGAILAVFEVADAPDSEEPASPPQPAHEPSPKAPVEPSPDGGAAARRPLASPAVRRKARELGVDLARVEGSGANGRIVAEDLVAPPVAAAARAAEPPIPRPGAVLQLTAVRRSIARTLTHAWQTIPHVIDYREADAGELLTVRARLKADALQRGDERLAAALTTLPLVIKSAAVALKAHPYVNASIDLEREEITLHEGCSIGIATATPAGLMVPVLPAADGKSLAEIALESVELVQAARANRLGPAQLSGGTFTVNNYGGLGIWLGTPIIRPPEVANLGIGAIRERVVAVDGKPAIRPICAIAVAGDHRALDGDTLAAFVTDVVRLIENPALLLTGLR